LYLIKDMLYIEINTMLLSKRNIHEDKLYLKIILIFSIDMINLIIN